MTRPTPRLIALLAALMALTTFGSLASAQQQPQLERSRPVGSRARAAGTPITDADVDAFQDTYRQGSAAESEAQAAPQQLDSAELEQNYTRTIAALSGAPITPNWTTSPGAERIDRQLEGYNQLVEEALSPRFDDLDDEARERATAQYRTQMTRLLTSVNTEITNANNVASSDPKQVQLAYDRLRLIEAQWSAATQVFPNELSFEDAYERLEGARETLEKQLGETPR